MSVLVQSAAFDPGAELNAFASGSAQAGAVAMFTGLVRDLNLGQQVQAMQLEHYPGMTEQALADIAAAAAARWSLIAARVIHRHGELLPGEPIVAVLCAAAHRGDAFAACECIMDRLKTEAPFWKREHTPAGARWVDARDSDERAARRWDAAAGQDDEHG
ncbi:MAG: molybdopterin synthase catalytic subunit MoaE [Pseudomonadota bacterium]|nr:molybdopterin synthase catalytic subunit MoaE [Pseudomonadota bacterium]